VVQVTYEKSSFNAKIKRLKVEILYITDNNNNTQFGSVKFNGCLLKCRLNNTRAYYKASTKTQILHKNCTNTQKQNTKQTKQKQYGSNKKKAIQTKQWSKNPQLLKHR
jgi:hypothetical protein